MLNRHRELTLPRLTAAPTATSSAYAQHSSVCGGRPDEALAVLLGPFVVCKPRTELKGTLWPLASRKPKPQAKGPRPDVTPAAAAARPAAAQATGREGQQGRNKAAAGTLLGCAVPGCSSTQVARAQRGTERMNVWATEQQCQEHLDTALRTLILRL